MNTRLFYQRGISLVEALVALLVISVGALAISNLHTNLIASSGSSKARSEATAIAQSNNERMRNLVQESQYAAIEASIVNEPELVPGINANFSLSWTMSDAGGSYASTNAQGTPISIPYSYKLVVSTVSWNDPKDGPLQVSQSMQIAWDNPTRSVVAASDNERDYLRPTGRAHMGGELPEDFDVVDAIANVIVTPDGTIEDGTRTYAVGDGTYLLLDADDPENVLVLMTMHGSSEEQGFSTINGRVFIQTGLPSNQNVDLINNINMRTSDAVYCREVLNSGGLFTNIANYDYVRYQCYAGEGWYGNVGLERLDSANPNDRVCLGDPEKSYTSDFDSKHPIRSSVRSYRGYIEEGSKYVPTGIGVTVVDGFIGPYVAVNYAEHDFLLARLGNNSTDADCIPRMELTTPSPFIDNAGKFLCFEGATCPTALGGVAAVTTTITGRINRSSSGNNRPTVSTIEIDGGQCDPPTETNQYYTYQCVINWSGWIGSGFDADLTLTLGDGNVLCSENTLGTIVLGEPIIRFTNENPPTENQVIPNQDMVIGYTQTECP